MNKTICALLFFVLVIAFINVFSSYKNINEGFSISGDIVFGIFAFVALLLIVIFVYAK